MQVIISELTCGLPACPAAEQRQAGADSQNRHSRRLRADRIDYEFVHKDIPANMNDLKLGAALKDRFVRGVPPPTRSDGHFVHNGGREDAISGTSTVTVGMPRPIIPSSGSSGCIVRGA